MPYAGIMFAFFEAQKRLCLWANGYTSSPFSEIVIPGVDQSLSPDQLQEWYAKMAEQGYDPRTMPRPPRMRSPTN
jgi:hypothetical protein